MKAKKERDGWENERKRWGTERRAEVKKEREGGENVTRHQSEKIPYLLVRQSWRLILPKLSSHHQAGISKTWKLSRLRQKQ